LVRGLIIEGIINGRVDNAAAINTRADAFFIPVTLSAGYCDYISIISAGQAYIFLWNITRYRLAPLPPGLFFPLTPFPHPDIIYSRPPPFKVKRGFAPLKNTPK
jgi:hypothetical protein